MFYKNSSLSFIPLKWTEIARDTTWFSICYEKRYQHLSLLEEFASYPETKLSECLKTCYPFRLYNSLCLKNLWHDEICLLDSSINQKNTRKAAFRQPGRIFKCLVELLSPWTGILKSILLIFRVRTTLLNEEATLFTNLTTSNSSKNKCIRPLYFLF